MILTNQGNLRLIAKTETVIFVKLKSNANYLTGICEVNTLALTITIMLAMSFCSRDELLVVI